MIRIRSFAALALVPAVVSFAGAAAAHIHLLNPTPRYPDEVSGENKNCPCGVGTGGRSCTKPEERSDPARSSDRATELMGGSMITVRLDEYIGHSGRYRVAFDPDGADLTDFNDHVLIDIPDPRGSAGNIGEGNIWEISAQLPNIDCDNCTLQVIQMMNGETEGPVLDPVGKSTYYQCADLSLTRNAALPEGYAEPVVVFEMLEPPNQDDTGDDPPVVSPPVSPPSMGSVSPVAGAGGTSSTPTTPVAMMSGDSSGGCSLGHARRSPGALPLAGAALALVWSARRRRPRRQ